MGRALRAIHGLSRHAFLAAKTRADGRYRILQH
jgi:hypothetical protein